MEELRWLACPGCSGEVGFPSDWNEAQVRCPNCGRSVEIPEPQAGVRWRPRTNSQATALDAEPGPSDERHTQAPAVESPTHAGQEHRSGEVAATSPEASTPPGNAAATTGLCLGIASVFLYVIGILPILAVVFSGIGLSKASSRQGKGQVAAWVGLVLGVLYTIMYLSLYKHI